MPLRNKSWPIYFVKKKRYYLTFLYCLQEKFLQCQKDMFKCIVAGNKTKLECLRESKGCLAELLPSQPPQFLVSADNEVPMQEIHKLRKINFLLSSWYIQLAFLIEIVLFLHFSNARLSCSNVWRVAASVWITTKTAWNSCYQLNTHHS